MDSPELTVMMWVSLAFNAVLLGVCIWYVIASRRSGRPLPPWLSAQLLFIVGMTALGVSYLVDETARIVLMSAGGMLGAFAGGRMWELAKQHLRDVGLVKAKAVIDSENEELNGQLGRAG